MEKSTDKKSWVIRKCLVCAMTRKEEESKEDYLRIKVCPNCKGAWVDTFYLGLYEGI